MMSSEKGFNPCTAHLGEQNVWAHGKQLEISNVGGFKFEYSFPKVFLVLPFLSGLRRGSREEESEFIRKTNSSQPLASLCGLGFSLVLSREMMGPRKSLMGSGKTWVPVPTLAHYRHTDSQKSLIPSAPRYPPLQT